jgi:hypothetical protein
VVRRSQPSATSFEFGLLLLFGGVIVILTFFLQTSPSRPWAWGAAPLVAVLMIRSSVRRRAKLGWRWPGATGRDWVRAGGAVAVGGVFGFVLVSVSHRPEAPQILLFLGAVTVFNALSALKVVTLREAEFLEQCGPERRSPRPFVGSRDPTWKWTVRTIYQTISLGAWLWAMAFFYVNEKAFDGGTLEPTGDRTVVMAEHGVVHYVTEGQKRLRDRLEQGLMFGVPSVLVLGLVVHFVLKVSLRADES